MTWFGNLKLSNLLIGIDLQNAAILRENAEIIKNREASRVAAERMARKIRAAREALCKPSDVMPTETQSAPSVLDGGPDPYGCDFETDGGYVEESSNKVFNIEHLTGAMDSSGRFVVTSDLGDHGFMTPESAKERGYAPFFSYAVQSNHGELHFEYGSLAYHQLTTLINNKIRDTYYPQHDYSNDTHHVPPPFVRMTMEKLARSLGICFDMVKQDDIVIPVGFYHHLLYLADEAEKMERDMKSFQSSFRPSEGGSANHDSSFTRPHIEELVETPIQPHVPPEVAPTNMSTDEAGPWDAHGSSFARPHVEKLVETPILTKAAPEVAPSNMSKERAGPSDVPKMSFAAVAALKFPKPASKPKPAPKPMKVEIHVTEKTEESKAPSDTKRVAKPAVRESNVDGEGFQAPKKPAPKMEMTTRKGLPMGTSSSSDSSRLPKPDNTQPTAFSNSGDKIVLNITEEENAQLMAKARRDETKRKLRQKADKREAAKKAAKEAEEKAEAELRGKMMNNLADYKQHLKSGRVTLRSERKELVTNDLQGYVNRLFELPPYDQSVLLAFEDKPRPNKSEEIVSKYITARLKVYTDKENATMIRYWSVLASGVNGDIMDDVLYMRRLLCLYKISEAEKEYYEKIYMRIAFEGDRESRLEVAIDSLKTDDPLIDLNKVKAYLQRRSVLLRSTRVLSETELEQLPNFEQAVYKLKDTVQPIDAIDMTELFIEWRRLCMNHSLPNIREWASGFNFMTHNPHVAFANDVYILFNINSLTNPDDVEWVEAFKAGEIWSRMLFAAGEPILAASEDLPMKNEEHSDNDEKVIKDKKELEMEEEELLEDRWMDEEDMGIDEDRGQLPEKKLMAPAWFLLNGKKKLKVVQTFLQSFSPTISLGFHSPRNVFNQKSRVAFPGIRASGSKAGIKGERY